MSFRVGRCLDDHWRLWDRVKLTVTITLTGSITGTGGRVSYTLTSTNKNGLVIRGFLSVRLLSPAPS